MSAVPVFEGNERDAGVVEEICGYLTQQPPRSYFLFAGAGSGKTRTLVEVLRRLTGVTEHEKGAVLASRLRMHGRSIRVVTYTKNAVAVINGRLGVNDLVQVSTIHSFCWELIGGFDDDIREALVAVKRTQLAEMVAKAERKKNGVSDTDRRNFAEVEEEIQGYVAATTFKYHPDKSTQGPGAIQHQHVLDATAWLLHNRPTLRTILRDRHPVVLIDESQDTMKSVLDALMAVAKPEASGLTLGLLGDHRQRIYHDGHEDLPSLVPSDWATPELRMNHRSQARIVTLINTIWASQLEGRTQPATGVEQHARTEKTGGVVRVFVGATSKSKEDKALGERWCSAQMNALTGAEAWTSDAYQLLALEHKLVAVRGSFPQVFEAMLLIDKNAAAPSGSGENTGPASVRFLLNELAELQDCFSDDGSFDEFAVTEVLRRHDRLAVLPADATARAARIDELMTAIAEFGARCSDPSSTVAQVIAPVLAARMFEPDSRLQDAFDDESAPPAPPGKGEEETKQARMRRGWCALFAAPWVELRKYRRYLAGNSVLATHQVVKGSEFEHVMVVMDDEEAGGFLISYDKLLGGKDLSSTDKSNKELGKETTIDRTLRLLYVTCSRARESLALVLWSADPAAALGRIKASGWFTGDEICSVP
ncbi:UvrD-helicase domain-containing protein [Pseudorhodoferax soli]|uniref:DNA 3'-5' helicase II n=1 Tax=Pseudorhodoferax soli TaxID=545864 RepID=A0A368XML0_9BURK|nr:UvrD-helicase domain-containing protein [Pseudorhodoferax soli]RCW69213.1 DNA helicase-2/ATP-dependent DNA helicase PcrA [Pseudorhodoferax soli]